MKKLSAGLFALAFIAIAGTAAAVPLPPERPALLASEDVVLARYGEGERRYSGRRNGGRHRGWMQGRHRGWTGGHHRGWARGRYAR